MAKKTEEEPIETLVGISFGDMFRAQEFLTAATRLAADKRFVLKDVVIVAKNESGHTVVRESIDPQPGRSAFSGALMSGIVGLLLGGPIGFFAGTAVGAGAGAVTAKVLDYGIPDEWVEWFREAVLPGTATVALLVSELDLEALIAEVKRFSGGRLVYANLDEDVLARIRAALGEVVLGGVLAPASSAVDAAAPEHPPTEPPAS